MKKITLLLLFTLTTIMLFSTHNLTINGEESTTVSLGDDLEIYFEFETAGNTATLSLMLDVPVIDLSSFDFLQGDLVDGGSLDTTPVDGIFQGTISAFWQAPSGIPLIVTVVDEDISAEVTLNFTDLNSSFSIAGSITQESNYGFDLPAYPALVNIFYNTSLTDFGELDLAGDFVDLLDFFEERFVISELNGFLGSYSANIPDTIPDVPCLVMPLSLLDFQGTHTAPAPYFGDFNGEVSDIDFLYTLPDGIFSGTVMDSEGTPIENALIGLYCAETEDNAVNYTDETGSFSIPLNNGTYSLMVTALNYELYSAQLIVSDQDIEMDISLIAVANDDQEVQAISSLEVRAFPNPFNSLVNIDIKSSSKQAISIDIYNLKGQLVNTISKQNLTSSNIQWNGKDANNSPVANGIYYLRVKQGELIINKKIVLIK